MDKPNSIKAFLKYGITPTHLYNIITNIKDIRHFKDCMEKYYLLYWSGYHICKQMSAGTILHQGTEYHVYFRNGLSRGRIMMSDQYALSFRKAHKEFGLPAVVYIS